MEGQKPESQKEEEAPGSWLLGAGLARFASGEVGVFKLDDVNRDSKSIMGGSGISNMDKIKTNCGKAGHENDGWSGVGRRRWAGCGLWMTLCMHPCVDPGDVLMSHD